MPSNINWEWTRPTDKVRQNYSAKMRGTVITRTGPNMECQKTEKF